MPERLPVRTCLWFAKDGLEAASFYTNLIKGSRIDGTFGETEGGEPVVIDFTLGTTPYQILVGGPRFSLTEAVSISVTTPDQGETDRLWNALTSDGGEESMCGWLKDRWGVSWQIVPEALTRANFGPDAAGAKRAFEAMMTMTKIDIATIEAAYRGD
ncbi:MAG: VOC family protein [Pseudomonadota bacterium]